jgi:hypothetical protein
VKQMICCCNKVFLLIFISTLFFLCFAPLFIWIFIMSFIKRS